MFSVTFICSDSGCDHEVELAMAPGPARELPEAAPCDCGAAMILLTVSDAPEVRLPLTIVAAPVAADELPLAA
ncbi:MAG: hypothetical protein ACR2NA_03405 [Solirubrobacterales bacterium]